MVKAFRVSTTPQHVLYALEDSMGGQWGEATYDPLENAKTFGPTLGDLNATLLMQTPWLLKDTLNVCPGDEPERSE